MIQLKIQAVKRLMEKEGLSLNQLSKRSDLNPGTLSRVLSGERKAGRKVIENLMSSLHCSFDEICETAELQESK